MNVTGCPDVADKVSKLRVAANATSKDPDAMTYVLQLYIAMADCVRKTSDFQDYFYLGNLIGNLFSLISEPESNDSDSLMIEWLNKFGGISTSVRQRDDLPQGALKPLADLYVFSSRDKMDADMRKQKPLERPVKT